jgi:hypothetical protein
MVRAAPKFQTDLAVSISDSITCKDAVSANCRSRSSPPPFSLLEAGHERAHVVHLSRRSGAFKDMERGRRMHPSFLGLAGGA